MVADYRYSLGVIGVGNMGAALVRGCVRGQALPATELVVWDVDQARAQALQEELGVAVAEGNGRLVADSAAVLLAVKPQSLPLLLSGLAGAWRSRQLVISIAAGVPLARLRAWVSTGVSVVRVMPNLPATVGAAAAAYCAGPEVSEAHMALVQQLLSSVGLAVSVSEDLMDAVTGLAGSGPAFAAIFCEGLADGGVAAGLPRAVAQQLAAQVLVGAGQWILQGGSPAALKDAVSSPGGTTIAGVERLEAGGLRGTALAAVQAAARRAAELGRESDQQ